MSNYECNICNYTTKEKSNLNRHLKSSKHIKNVSHDLTINSENIITESHKKSNSNGTQMEPKWNPNGTSDKQKKVIHACKYCENVFSGANSLARHIKSCYTKQEKENILEEQIRQLNEKLLQFEMSNEHYIKENEHYKAETNHYKQMLREAGGIVKKSVSSLTYAMDNYNTAPALKTMEIKEIEYFDETEKKIVEDILSSYKHKTVGKYLGDLIIKIHKKDDPKNQSIWNTDDNRLTYLIKELMHNDSSNWIIDKKGIKTQTYLIEPLLTHVKVLLVSYQTNFTIPDFKQNSVEMEFILENSKRVIDLINDIDDGLIGKDVLKHISLHLRFPTKAIE